MNKTSFLFIMVGYFSFYFHPFEHLCFVFASGHFSGGIELSKWVSDNVAVIYLGIHY